MPLKRPYIDLTGQRFGRLTVIRLITEQQGSKGKQARWLCRCDCGKSAKVRGDVLRYNFTKSCGCLLDEARIKAGRATRKHGDAIKSKGCPEYRVWANMKDRCLNPNAQSFKHYGARGIKVCKRWIDYQNFLADMGRRPSPQHSIDRINNDGDYKPSNCRWLLSSKQNGNRRDYDHGAHLRGTKLSAKTRRKISRAIKRHWIERRTV